MKTRPTALFAALFAVAVLAVSPSSTEAQEVAIHRVVISLDAQGGLQYSLNPVVAYPGDRVIFSAPGMDSWSVTFPEATPFANRTISGNGTQERNVPILPDAAAGTYKYDVSVTVDGRTVTEDPDIIVRGRGDPTPPVR